MIGILAIAATALVALQLLRAYQSYARNLVEAKKSGIPYVKVPVYMHHFPWLLTNRLILPLLHKLPASWTSPWIEFLHPEWLFRLGYDVFKRYNSDLLLFVTPQRNFLAVADAEACAQIVQRRNDFPKPIWMYRNIDLFGKNVVTSEGSLWRQHRKISAPSFGEKNNSLVWKESIHQSQNMVRAWLRPKKESGIVQDVTEGTMRLALHVISRAGFGVRVQWPHEEREAEANNEKTTGFSALKPAGSHKLSYKDAIEGLLENLVWSVILPTWFLKRSPWKNHRVALQSRIEWGQYMTELYEAKLSEVRSGESKTEGMDLLGSLVRGSGIAEVDSESGKSSLLSESEVLGNAFVFILAGHETTSNAMGFSLLLLAMNPASQRMLQEDIDRILGDKDVEDWTYEEDFPKLFGGMPAAVMNETLRLVPSVVGIPKSTPAGAPQPLTMSGGKRVVVPQDCAIALDTPGLHRNPKYWPRYNTNEFRPERWILDTHASSESQDDDFAQPDDGGPSGPDTSAQLFKPQKGSFIPFSEGFRSCLGRRFAQVESLAVLTYIFRWYSVELAVDRWADEAAVQQMTPGQKQEVWQKAHSRAEGLLKTHMESRITLQMRGEKVALRLVKRGQETFG